MKVLSLFDGISSGRLALERAGIPVEKYYASEIDKYAIQIAQKNYPDTIQVGDVTKLNYLELLDVDIVIGGSPCFQADTMVFTDKGYVQIQDIQIGDMVLTHNGRYKPVLAVGKRWANNCRKLKAETMLPILTTGNHPFLTDKDFVECDNLNKGDIVIAAKTDFSGEDMSLVDAYLLGRYVADGYIIDSLRAGRKNSYNHKVVFCVGKGKNEQFEFFTFAKHFIKSKEKNVTKYTIIDKKFMELCKKCGKGALNKQIPQIIFSCPTEIKKMFLQGYMDGDGNKYKDGYTATTVSKKLALGLQLLLSSLGYKNHIYFNKRPEKYIIQGRIVNQHDTYQVRFYPNAKEWVKEKKIQSKLQIEDNYVYNIEVADDHTYIADNYIVHNCQDLSIAKQNREGLRGARSGLFWKYVEALEVIRPKWFLLENVASMRNEDRDAITATLKKIYPETECIMINSALVSAQQRRRYYWTNWHVEQPQDKGILLKDILESGQVIRDGKSHAVISSVGRTTEREYFKKNQGELVAVPCAMRTREDELGKFKRLETKDDYKANSLTSVQTDSMVAEPLVPFVQSKLPDIEKKFGELPPMFNPYNKQKITDKAPTQTAQCGSQTKSSTVMMFQPVRIGELAGCGTGQANRIYSVRGKSVCLNANGGGGGAKTGLYKVDLPDGDYIIRKLTPVECERLQTLTSVKNKYIIHICLDNQKNYVSAENQNPKSLSVVGSVENDRKKESVSCAEQNSNANNLLLNNVALPNVQVSIGENLLAIRYQNTVLLNASFAEILNKFPHLKAIENFARTFVLINTIVAQTTNNGKVESQQKETNLIQVQNGNTVVELCGKEIKPLVEYADKNMSTVQKLLNATTLYPLSIKNTEQTLQTLFYYVANVICSFIPKEIQSNCILNIQTDLGYTFGVSNTQRYKAIGNGWTVDVIAWILGGIQ